MQEPTPKAQIVGIIPARWDSSRFPGKPLHHLCGKPLLQHVFERAQHCKQLSDLYIATDDSRIEKAARNFGAQVLMTAKEHPSGTDRIAEAARQLPAASHVINIQGDEPLLDPALVDELVLTLANDTSIDLITAASPIHTPDQLADPNIVKVVLNHVSDALYFSRSPIPHFRGKNTGTSLRHIGLYGYRSDLLQKFVAWPPSPLEEAESLEQLRALHNGAKIRVIMTKHEAIGLDTPEQVPLLEDLLTQQTGITN